MSIQLELMLAQEVVHNIQIGAANRTLRPYHSRVYRNGGAPKIYLNLNGNDCGHFEIIGHRICGCYELAKPGRADDIFQLLTALGYAVQRGTKPHVNTLYGQRKLS